MKVHCHHILFFLACLVGASASKCASNADCSFNGKCTAKGLCACRAAWSGPSCATLELLPATKGAGLHGIGSNTSSWGGSVLKGEDGKYHMWASEMINHCGLNLWTTNSHVVHAVADSPGAAYTVADEVWPVFAHEPSVARGPKGEYVMYFVKGHPKTPWDDPAKPCQCSDGSSSAECDTSCTWTNGTFMSYATSPAGPWSRPLEVLPHPLGPVDSNLAVVIAQNGSLVGLTRKIPGGEQGSEIHLLTASDWTDKATYKQSADPVFSDKVISNFGLEDPFLYTDADGNYHAIFHNMLNNDDQKTCGSHAYSEDGISWTFTGTAYSNKVKWTDGNGLCCC
eukprot:g1499.t1